MHGVSFRIQVCIEKEKRVALRAPCCHMGQAPWPWHIDRGHLCICEVPDLEVAVASILEAIACWRFGSRAGGGGRACGVSGTGVLMCGSALCLLLFDIGGGDGMGVAVLKRLLTLLEEVVEAGWVGMETEGWVTREQVWLWVTQGVCMHYYQRSPVKTQDSGIPVTLYLCSGKILVF